MINWTGLWVTVSLIANFYALHTHDTPLTSKRNPLPLGGGQTQEMYDLL